MQHLTSTLARETRSGGLVKILCATVAALAFLALPSARGQGAPQLTSVTPANGASGVALDAPLVFVFDQPMMVEVPILPSLPGVFIGNLELSPAASAPSVDGSWSDDGLTLTCTPSAEWPASTKITWKLNPAGSVMPISSEAGIPLASVSGQFTTGAGGGGGGDAPGLVSSIPDNGALGVPVTTLVKFVFDQPMKQVTALDGAVGWHAAGVDPAKFVYAWSADGLTLTADYTGDLPANTLIAWVLNPESSTLKLESEAGEVLPENTYSGGFRTAQGGGGGDCDPDGIPATWGGYNVSKGATYEQTSASDPAPAAEGPFHFGAFLFDVETGPKVTQGAVTLPDNTTRPLDKPSFVGFWLFTDMPATEAALHAAYPAGNYTLRFTRSGEAERVITMSMPAVTIPVPKLANYAEAQAINHAQAFTLRWNAFTGAGVSDYVSLAVNDRMGKVVFQAPDQCVPRDLPVTATAIVLPANTLENNMTYSATLLFGRMFYFSTNTVPDMAGSGTLSRQTHFTIKTGTGGTGTAARFTGYRSLPNGNPEMTLSGTPLTFYTIQRTGSVGAPAWMNVGTVIMDGVGAAVFEDTAANKTFPLFYRAVAN